MPGKRKTPSRVGKKKDKTPHPSNTKKPKKVTTKATEKPKKPKKVTTKCDKCDTIVKEETAIFVDGVNYCSRCFAMKIVGPLK
jgi:formylmethanofuran dehydrogenase subunit E